MNIKRTTLLLAVACMLLSLTPNVLSAGEPAAPVPEEIILKINGAVQAFDQPPVRINNRTMVPVRGIFEKLGAEVLWNEEERTVTATKDHITVKLTIGAKEAEIGGVKQALDSPAIVMNNRTLVPARFVSEAMGSIVEWDEQRNTVNIYTVRQELYDVLKKFDAKFDKSVMDWTASLYDKESGGFYYSASARDNEGFAADIETTNQMISIWEMSRLLPPGNPPEELLPLEIKEKLIKFMQERQDPDDGYFYDKQFGKNVGNSKKARNLSQGVSTLKRYEAEPFYTPATERIAGGNEDGDAATPDYLQSEEAFKAWLQSLPWGENNYSAGSSVSAAKNLISAAGYMEIAQEFAISIQNKETGLWGNDLSFDSLNGAMKLVGVFNKACPYPNIDKMLESVIHIVTNEQATTTAMLWNPLTLIKQAQATYGGFSGEQKEVLDANLVKVLDITADKLDDFRQPDNGYSWSPMGSSVTSQGARVSLGMVEGDVNGTLLAFMCRRDAYGLAGLTAPPIWDIYREEYWDRCFNQEKYKVENAPEGEKGFFYDFEEAEPGKLPLGWKKVAARGSVAVKKDPYNDENQVLEIMTVPGEATKTNASFGGGKAFERLSLEFKMMVYEANSGAFFYNDIGQAVQWCLVGASKSAKITNRQSSQGTGDDCAVLDLETWHDVKIVYEPNNQSGAMIQFYVDGYLEMETGRYFGIDNGTPNPKTIDAITFTSFKNGEGILYLDDVKVTVEENKME